MASKVTARARVRIIVELNLPDAWGADCPVEQIHKQARDGAVGALRRGLVIAVASARQSVEPTQFATVIGEPEVTAILVDEAKP